MTYPTNSPSCIKGCRLSFVSLLHLLPSQPRPPISYICLKRSNKSGLRWWLQARLLNTLIIACKRPTLLPGLTLVLFLSFNQMPLPITKPSKVLATATPWMFLLIFGKNWTTTTHFKPFRRHFNTRDNNTQLTNGNTVKYLCCQPLSYPPFAIIPHLWSNYHASQAAFTRHYLIALPCCRHRTYVLPFRTNPINQDKLNAFIKMRKKKRYIKLMMILSLKSMKKILTQKTPSSPTRATRSYKSILWE